MMRQRSFLLLFVIFIGLGAAVALQSANQPQPTPLPLPTPSPEATIPQGTLLRIFPDLTVRDIQAIRLENPNTDQQLTLQRDSSGQWTAPDVEGELDTEAVTSIARTLVLLPYERSINIVSTTELADYGFGTRGQFLIQIVLANDEGHGIVIGSEVEGEPTYYALVDNRDEIFRIERGAIDFLIQFLNLPPINLTK